MPDISVQISDNRKSFEDLEVFKRSYRLSLEIHKLSKQMLEAYRDEYKEVSKMLHGYIKHLANFLTSDIGCLKSEVR